MLSVGLIQTLQRKSGAADLVASGHNVKIDWQHSAQLLLLNVYNYLYTCASNFTPFSPYRKAAVHHICIYRCDAAMSHLSGSSVVCSSLS